MRRPQIVIFERDGRLARQLESLATERRWVIRESRQSDSCLRLLNAEGPTVLVVRIGTDTETELQLLADAAVVPAELAAVAVCDGPPALTGMAWDLGADYVVTQPSPPDRLSQVVSGLMGTA